MAVTDPTAPTTPAADLQSLLIAQLAPIAQQAAAQASQDATAGLSSIVAGMQSDLSNVQKTVQAHEAQLASAATDAVTQLEPQVVTAGTALLTTVEHDPLTQRVLIWGIAGAVLLAALAIVGFALLGNSTALRWIGAAPGAAIALVLWLSDARASLPKPSAKI